MFNLMHVAVKSGKKMHLEAPHNSDVQFNGFHSCIRSAVCEYTVEMTS